MESNITRKEAEKEIRAYCKSINCVFSRSNMNIGGFACYKVQDEFSRTLIKDVFWMIYENCQNGYIESQLN